MILGLDVSTSTGFSILDTNKKLISNGCIKLKMKGLRERIDCLTNEISKLIKEFKPTLIIIGDIYHGPNVKTTALLNKLQGAIIKSIPKSIEIICVNASRARKEVLGPGKRYSKLDVFNLIVKEFNLKNYEFKRDNDITDAILLSLYGLSRHCS